VATGQQLAALEQAFRAGLQNCWQQLGQQGPLPLLLDSPVALPSAPQGGLVTVAFHVVLPSAAAQQIRGTALNYCGGVYVQVPGTAGFTLVHLHDPHLGPLYLFTLTTTWRRYPPANLVQYLAQQSGRFAGMRVLWVGVTGLRGCQVSSRISVTGELLADVAVPHASLAPLSVVGLAVGGQRVLAEPVVVSYPDVGVETFVLRRLPNRARALGPSGPAPPSTSGPSGLAAGTAPAAPQPAAPNSAANIPVRPADHQQPGGATGGQPQQPRPTSPRTGPPSTNRPPDASPSPSTRVPPPPPPRGTPSSQPSGTQREKLLHQWVTRPTQPIPSAPAASAPAAGSGKPRRATPAMPPAVGQWLRLSCSTGPNQPQVVLVVTHVWDASKRLYLARVLFPDGGSLDLGPGDWPTAYPLSVATVSPAVRGRLAQAILASPGLIPSGSAIPDWVVCGITFPPGTAPPAASAGRPPQSGRTPAAPTAQPSPPAPVKVSRQRGHQPGVVHPHSKKTRTAQARRTTTSDGSYGDRGSMSADDYDRYASMMAHEHVEPAEPSCPSDVDMSAGTNAKANGPREGHRPRRR
jgi:hypothetical protein